MKYFFFVMVLINSTLAVADVFSDRLSAFSTLKISQAKFIESWSAEYLDEPIVTTGTLLYQAPGILPGILHGKFTGQLKKTIESPELIVQSIEGDQLSITRGDETTLMSLSEKPVLAAGIYALRDVLEGNKKSLQQRFVSRYSETKKTWTLSLKPKNNAVAKKIKAIIFRGKLNQIQQVHITYHNGDSLITEILHDE